MTRGVSAERLAAQHLLDVLRVGRVACARIMAEMTSEELAEVMQRSQLMLERAAGHLGARGESTSSS